jgi:hypothetical protein
MSLQTQPTPSQATRCGDRNHKAGITRQRKAAASPCEQATAIANIIRKRIADGQAIPDLDRYGLTDTVWAELLDILDADELSTIADACGADNSDDSDDEPSTDDLTIAFGDMPLIPEPPASQQTPLAAHGWRDQNPLYTHSLKWRDGDGIEHLHVIRSDDLDELLRQVKTIKVVIAAAKARDAKACDPAPVPTTNSRPDWCHVHNVAMKQRGDETQGYWHSHKVTDGLWCRGKGKA